MWVLQQSFHKEVLFPDTLYISEIGLNWKFLMGFQTSKAYLSIFTIQVLALDSRNHKILQSFDSTADLNMKCSLVCLNLDFARSDHFEGL